MVLHDPDMDERESEKFESVVELLAARAQRWPERGILSEGDRRCSVAQLHTRMLRLSDALARRLEPGERVVVQLADRIDHAALTFACFNVGLVPVQLNPYRTPAFVRRAHEASGAALVCVDRNTAPELESLETPSVAELEAEAEREHGGRPRGELATILFTSGATGAPKGVMLSHRALLACGARNMAMCELDASARELTWHVTGATYQIGALYAHLLAGSEQLASSLSPHAASLPALLDEVEQRRITHLHLRATLLRALVEKHETLLRARGRGLRVLGTGWVLLDTHILSALIQALPETGIMSIYGLTEASRSACIYFNRHPDKLRSSGQAPRGGGLRIASPDAEGRGEVQVFGPTTMLGYWQLEQASARRLTPDGWVRTGDLGTLDAEGFVSLLGRIDDMLNVDGWKFFPRKLEQLLESHPAVAAAAVAGVPDRRINHRPGALVVARGQASPALAETLATFVFAHTEHPRRRPIDIMFVDALPLNDQAKIVRPEVVRLLSEARPGA